MTLPEPPKKKEPVKYNHGDYPALSSSSTKPRAWNAKTSDLKEQEQDEFPTLASAAKIKKSPMIKGTVINFAEAAKKKKASPSSKSASANAKRSLLHRPHKYSHQKLTQPVHIPWLETGSSLNSVYMKEVSFLSFMYLICIAKTGLFLFYFYFSLILERTSHRIWHASK